MPGLKLHNGDTVVFAGDSITDCGRMQNPPFGYGYVYIFNNLILAKHPSIKISVVNAGVSGDTVIELKSRWEDDVLSFSPDWVSILIGINDIHRMLSGQQGYDAENYYRNYRDILTLTKKKCENAKLILLAPFYISKATTGNTHRRRVLEAIPNYIEKVKQLSEEFSAIFVDLHAMFQSMLTYREPVAYAPEAVHPNFAGHTAIALAILSVLES